jgi:hypothetical protein
MTDKFKVQMATEIRRSGYKWADVSKPVASLRLARQIKDSLKSANPQNLYRAVNVRN